MDDELLILAELTAEELARRYVKGELRTSSEITNDITKIINGLNSNRINAQRIIIELSKQRYLERSKGYIKFLY
ncbi:MAG: hypothetical protein KKF67_01810 [Nanoarchaeota archaeon]|nr:hypothetical protein [Nanoarchaeota archaeon]